MLDSNNCLPPTSAPTASHGYFRLTPTSLFLDSPTPTTPIFRLLFWGASEPIYLSLSETADYSLSASLSKFKHYLIDCQATCLQVLDSRNRKPLARAYLSWTPYLRPLEDRLLHQPPGTRPYYLPFYDQAIDVNLPLYSPAVGQKQPKPTDKIGELQIHWESRVWGDENREISQASSAQRLYNVRVSEAGQLKAEDSRNFQQPISICNIDLGPEDAASVRNQDVRTNRTIRSNLTQNSPHNRLLTTEFGQRPSRNNPSLLGVKEEESSRHQWQPKEERSGLEVELLRLRLEGEALVGAGQRDQQLLVFISHFESISKGFPAKELVSIEVRSQTGDKSTHSRVFVQNVEGERSMLSSSLVCASNASISFSCNWKKSKETVKGNTVLSWANDTTDVNMISQQGVILGFIRLKIQRNQQQEKKPQQEKPVAVKKIERKASEKKEQERKDNPLNPIQLPRPKAPEKRIEEKKQPPKIIEQQPQKVQNSQYLLVMVKEEGRYQLDYSILDQHISHSNPNKFLLLSQKDTHNKPYSILVFQSQQLVHQQNLLPQLPNIPPSPHNLTCSLIHQLPIPSLAINIQLYAGSLSQVNHFLQNMSTSKQQHRNRQQTLQTEQDWKEDRTEKAKEDRQERIERGERRQDRKLRTEAAGTLQDRARLLTEQKVSGAQSVVPMDKLSLNQHQLSEHNANQDDDNFYLVDLLTRFLAALPQSLLPPSGTLPKSQFLQQIASVATQQPALQSELVQVIAGIFVDGERVELGQLKQCIQAYSSFAKIYGEQKKALLEQIRAGQPRAAQRIKANCEMGMLNESMLWGRALSKLKDPSLRQRINKFYKISAFANTEAAFLLDDLSAPSSEPNNVLRPLDIGNMGMLVREWVEKFLGQTGGGDTLRERLGGVGEQQNWLNIRQVGQVLEECMGLKLSVWESLMLIQQVKATYSCDLQLEEGLLSAAALLSWAQSVQSRHRQSSCASSRASLDAEELALIQQMNQPNSQQPTHRQKEREEVSSAIIPQNDSDIVDIANLLREKDGFMPFSKVQAIKKDNNSSIQIFSPLKHVAESKHFETNRQKTEQPEQVRPERIENIKPKKQVKQSKSFFVQIKAIKLYHTHPQLLKATFSLSGSEPTFYYLTQESDYSEANGQSFPLALNLSDSHQLSSSLHLAITDERDRQVANGLLPLEEVGEWLERGDPECKKTVVIYEGVGKIGGKLAVRLLLASDNLTDKKMQSQESKVTVVLNSMSPLLNGKLFVSAVDEEERQELIQGQTLTVRLSKPLYHSELHIQDDSGELSCTLSLEEVYLRKRLQAQYPLININSATFASTLTLTLATNPNPTQIIPTNNISTNNDNPPLQQKKVEQGNWVIILGEIAGIGYKTTYHFTGKLCIYGYSPLSVGNKERLLLSTPQLNFKVKQQPIRHAFSHQRLESSSNQDITHIQFKLIEGPRVLASTQRISISEVTSGLNGAWICLEGTSKVLLGISIKKLTVGEYKYSLRRVYDCLEEIQQPISNKQLDSYLRTAKKKHNLTATESQILKEIAEINKDNMETTQVVHGQSIVQFPFTIPPLDQPQLTELLQQFMYAQLETNNTLNGTLPSSEVNQILTALACDLPHSHPYHSLLALPLPPYSCLLQLAASQPPSQPVGGLFAQVDGLYQSMKQKYG